MPRGYELNSYYDSMRAVQRRIYSAQIKKLSSTIEKLSLGHSDAYRLIISSLNNGIYESLSPEIYQKTHFGNNSENYIGNNKSSYEQDFMSPMELRLNAIAVYRAQKQIENLIKYRGTSLKDIQDICYTTGAEVASEFGYLLDGKEEFSMRISEPILSTKPIIKKYEHALVMGTLPKNQTISSDNPEAEKEKETLIYLNTTTFSRVKAKLIELGLASSAQRQFAFSMFNSAYYETTASNQHNLEITKILIVDKLNNYVTNQELAMNYEKLCYMLSALNNYHPSKQIFPYLEEHGAKARQIIVAKHKVLPELFSGFYYSYTDVDKKLTMQKKIKDSDKTSK